MSPDPRFLWMGEKHKEALASLEYGIIENKGFLLLTGDAGAGKTLIINALAKSERVQALIATIPDPDLEILDFFNFLSEEFQMNRHFDSKGAFLIHFKHFLHEVYAAEGKVLLIIDEAQRLNHDLLEQIRILSNIEYDFRKLINIFLVGQSELNQVLREERNVAFRKRIAVSYHLDPLDETETKNYIHHRLNVAGATEEIFNAAATREIHYFSMGYPRLINIICDHALLIGYSKGIHLIDDGVIASCKQDLRILGEPNTLLAEDSHQNENQEEYRFDKIPVRLTAANRNWVYAGIVLAFLISGLALSNFMWKDRSHTEVRASHQVSDNNLSEKQSPSPEYVNKEDVGKGKVPQNHQMDYAAVRGKNHAGRNKMALSEVQGQELLKSAEALKNDLSAPESKTVIQFEHDSMTLPDEAYALLDQVVKLSSSRPGSEIIVEGYTDSFGDYIYNKDLSKSRADVIKEYLVKVGIPSTKIKTFGMGPQNPIASNKTREGRKQNRRIEIRIKAK
ncbi:MAG: OmpA family protein [Desulfobacterales bacterium]|jgi:general secretion pathway protein A